MRFLDLALRSLNSSLLQEYEEEIELWITYGGD